MADDSSIVIEDEVIARVTPQLMQTDKACRDKVKYNIKVDEIARRIASPEHYSLANLTSYLHLARTGAIENITFGQCRFQNERDKEQ